MGARSDKEPLASPRNFFPGRKRRVAEHDVTTVPALRKQEPYNAGELRAKNGCEFR
jgi:hypothetical protein